MLFQNFKGFLTLALVLSLVATSFYFYKGIVEPGVIQKNSLEQFAVSTEEIEVKPQIEVYPNKAVVTWDTPYESSGVVKYCTNPEEPPTCNKSQTSFGKNHRVTLDKLDSNKTYYYNIGIDNNMYPSQKGSHYKFVTGGLNGKKSKLAEYIAKESPTQKDFNAAMKNQDLKYDYNKDGKITVADYASFKSQQ
jgi:hypothetical protein